jgi:hypothetical protein
MSSSVLLSKKSKKQSEPQVHAEFLPVGLVVPMAMLHKVVAEGC